MSGFNLGNSYYCNDSTDEEKTPSTVEIIDQSKKCKPNSNVVLYLEGNIASGKTSLLKRIEGLGNFLCVPEPVDHWKNMGYITNDGIHKTINLLERYYTHPTLYGMTFQLNVINDIVDRHKTFVNYANSIILERSLYSCRDVFMKSMKEQETLHMLDFGILYNTIDNFIKFDACKCDGYIYLNVSADTCFQRMKVRGREEERNITLDYLRRIEHLHDNMVWKLERENVPVLRLYGNETDEELNCALHSFIIHKQTMLEQTNLMDVLYHEAIKPNDYFSRFKFDDVPKDDAKN